MPRIKCKQNTLKLLFSVVILSIFHIIIAFGHEISVCIAHSQSLTIKAAITTAADDIICDIFPNFRKK